jgi:nucleolar complex protein 2
LKGAKNGEMNQLKKLMVAFRCGCYSTEGTTKSGQEAQLPFEIAGDKTFAHLMSTVLKNSNYLFQLFAGPSNKYWTKIERVVKAFFLNASHYIATCASNDALLLALNQLEPYITWLSKLKGPTSKKLLKSVLDRWSEHPDLDIKGAAFRNIREMALKVPFPFVNSCLKGVYLNYVREAKFFNPSTTQKIEFMAECVVELYLLDPILAYQHAFVYIRQLAIHLRNFIQTQTKVISFF